MYLRTFISTVGFSNEDNCCQSQGIGKLIKNKILKGIFRVDELIKCRSQYTTLDFVKFIVNISEQTTNFFYKSAFLEFLLFPKSCLKVRSVAYTRVFTLVLFSLYSITIISFVIKSFIFRC